MRLRIWACASLLAAACGGGTEPIDGAVDAPSDVGASDAPADRPTCTTDDDADGHAAASCGGDDCDDADPNAYPGNAELCDAAGHDEDCDAATLGPDADGDGAASDACCNMQPGGSMQCGADCDDTRATVGPTGVESCNGIDDDCDGAVDDGVAVAYGADCDGDGYGSTSATMSGCNAPTTPPPCGSGGPFYWTPVGGDCDDSDAAVNPGATERCDGVDDDCDGATDPEPVASDSCSVHGISSCVSGACTMPVCPGAFLDCDALSVGCETDSRSDPLNCGGCGIACVSPRCVSGVCVDDFIGVGAGDDFTCGVRHSGRVACWGTNNHGQLGDGTRVDRYTPVEVVGVSDVQQLVVGSVHSCVRHSDGTLTCWGGNAQGALGDGTTMDRPTAVDVPGITDAAGLALGQFHTCVRRTSGRVSCWGGGNLGQLGNGLHSDSPTPVFATGITDAVSISAAYETTCVVHPSAEISCWGRNGEGEMGNGVITSRQDVPALAGAGTSGTPLGGVSLVGVGDRHVCAVVNAGRTVSCWGDDTVGQLGRGVTSATPSAIPMPVMTAGSSPSSVITTIDAGQTHTCVRRNGGGIKCWGANAHGELGDGTMSSTYIWVSASLGTEIAYGVAVGATHSCARVGIGQILCWGSNAHGELGDGTVIPHSVPTAIVDP